MVVAGVYCGSVFSSDGAAVWGLTPSAFAALIGLLVWMGIGAMVVDR